MKLSSDFISHFDGEETVLVPVGGAAFSGIVKLNSSAAFIVDKLKEDTTEQAITDAMCETFDAPPRNARARREEGRFAAPRDRRCDGLTELITIPPLRRGFRSGGIVLLLFPAVIVSSRSCGTRPHQDQSTPRSPANGFIKPDFPEMSLFPLHRPYLKYGYNTHL